MEELNEINQTLCDLCTLFARKADEDARFEESLKELDALMESIRTNREKNRTDTVTI